MEAPFTVRVSDAIDDFRRFGADGWAPEVVNIIPTLDEILDECCYQGIHRDAVREISRHLAAIRLILAEHGYLLEAGND